MAKQTFIQFLKTNGLETTLTHQQQELAQAVSCQNRLVFLPGSSAYGRAIVFRLWARYMKEGKQCQTIKATG